MGIDVCQARDGAVGAGHVRAVDDDLMAGEHLQRVAGVFVLEAEPTERDVVARGVLDALDDTVGAQTDEHRGVELGVDASRQVVREQRKVGVLADSAEVTLGLLRAAEGVEGRGCDQAVDAVARGALGLITTRRVSMSMMPARTGTRPCTIATASCSTW